MKIPNTPITLIEKLTDPKKSEIWNGAWRNFFDIYHAPIKVMVSNTFANKGWYTVPAQVIDDVIADVVVSLNDVFQNGAYDKNRSKFRFYLKTICRNRVMDYMRKNYRNLSAKYIADDDSFDEIYPSDEDLAHTLEESEIAAFQNAMLLDIYETIRSNFCPAECVAFEMVKLQNQKVGDVAKTLGIEPKQISSIIFKISKMLREAVEKENAFEELKDGK